MLCVYFTWSSTDLLTINHTGYRIYIGVPTYYVAKRIADRAWHAWAKQKKIHAQELHVLKRWK